MTVMTSRQLNQDTGRAKRAAHSGPVFITERGAPRFVLLNMNEYQRITGQGASLADLLGDHAAAEVELDLPGRDDPDAHRPIPDFGDDSD